MSVSPEIAQSAEAAGLTYVEHAAPGIRRIRRGKGFSFVGPDGLPVTDSVVLSRIRRLAIPPAYRDVWICLDPRGHLQATGKDAKGRTQYVYHPEFRRVREESKFHSLSEFGRAAQSIRERVAHDLGKHGLPKEKVLAVIVYLLEKSLIRIGSPEYAKQNRSYGLTTLRSRHVKVEGQTIFFRFMGKSHVRHDIEIHDQRLAGVVRKIQELPGQELFHYVDDLGSIASVTSAEVNGYLREITGRSFTAKDFRTWWASVLAVIELGRRETPTTKGEAKRAVSATMKAVSKQLGNTPSVCRKCYVHPLVVEAFTNGELRPDFSDSAHEQEITEAAEEYLLALLERYESDAAA